MQVTRWIVMVRLWTLSLSFLSEYSQKVLVADVTEVSYTQFLHSYDEYIPNTVFSQDGTLAFALVRSRSRSRKGQPDRVIVTELGNLPSVRMYSKTLVQSVDKLELVTIDNRYLLTHDLYQIEVAALLNSTINIVPIKPLSPDTSKNNSLGSIECLKHTPTHSSVLMVTSSSIEYIYQYTTDFFVKMDSNANVYHSPCVGVVSSFKDAVVYGLSANRLQLIVATYLHPSHWQYFNIPLDEVADIADIQQPLVISPLGNYVLLLTRYKVRLFSVSAFGGTSLGTYEKGLTLADFINDNTIIGYEHNIGKFIVLSFGTAGNFVLLGEYKSQSFVGTTYLKALHNNFAISCDNQLLKVLSINDDIPKSESQEWSYAVMIIGLFMTVLMSGVAVYAVYYLRPAFWMPTKDYASADTTLDPSHRSINPAESPASGLRPDESSLVATENLATDQDLTSYTGLLKRAITCPLTLQVISDPVIASDGFSYERAAIESWLVDNHLSPITKSEMSSNDLLPNYALAKLIAQFRRQPPS